MLMHRSEAYERGTGIMLHFEAQVAINLPQFVFGFAFFDASGVGELELSMPLGNEFITVNRQSEALSLCQCSLPMSAYQKTSELDEEINRRSGSIDKTRNDCKTN